jgi:ribosomal protein S6
MTDEAIKEDIAQDSADEAETQVYEIGFHIVPTVEEVDLGKEVDSIKSLIESNGGVFISDEFPKNIDLAYTIVKNIEGNIKKFDNAYFGWVKFEMKTDSIINVKEELDLNKNVLRYLIIKTVKESTLTPKSVISPKGEVARVTTPRTPLKTEAVKEESQPVKAEKTPVSEEELDKTIEELVAE